MDYKCTENQNILLSVWMQMQAFFLSYFFYVFRL